MKLGLTAFVAVLVSSSAGAQSGLLEGFERLLGANGSITVLIASDTNPDLSGHLIEMLSESAVKDLRVGIADGVEDREALRSDFEDKFAAQDVLRFCDQWLTEQAGQRSIADFVAAQFGGSLVVIDNDTNDRERFGPAIGEDPWLGVEENPILFGIFGEGSSTGLVMDAEQYRAAWQTVDGIPVGLDESGC